jgi:hypothetical protein
MPKKAWDQKNRKIKERKSFYDLGIFLKGFFLKKWNCPLVYFWRTSGIVQVVPETGFNEG